MARGDARRVPRPDLAGVLRVALHLRAPSPAGQSISAELLGVCVSTGVWWHRRHDALVARGLRTVRPQAGRNRSMGLFWMASFSGFVFAIWQRRMFGLMLITVPVSAALLATLRIVPPNERLGLWIVPALYASVAMAGDAPVWLGRRYSNRRSLTMLAGRRVPRSDRHAGVRGCFPAGAAGARGQTDEQLRARRSQQRPRAPGAPSSWRRRHDDPLRVGGAMVVQRVEYRRSRRRQPASGRQSDFRDRARCHSACGRS